MVRWHRCIDVTITDGVAKDPKLGFYIYVGVLNQPWYEVGEYISGRPPAQLYHKASQEMLSQKKRLSEV